MEKELFRYFIRKNYNNVEISNNECDGVCEMFTDYLNSKCSPEQLKKFLPQNPLEVIAEADHPFKMNGFHPALVIHFNDFITEAKNKATRTN